MYEILSNYSPLNLLSPIICFIIYCIDNLISSFLPISTLVISYFRTRTFFTISTATRRRNS